MRQWHSCCHMRHIKLSLFGKQRANDQLSLLVQNNETKHQAQHHSMLHTREETEVMGIEWLGKMNGNGDILADLCAFNNIFKGGRQNRNAGFIRQPVYNRTNKTENQIDHICIRKYSEDQCRM